MGLDVGEDDLQGAKQIILPAGINAHPEGHSFFPFQHQRSPSASGVSEVDRVVAYRGDFIPGEASLQPDSADTGKHHPSASVEGQLHLSPNRHQRQTPEEYRAEQKRDAKQRHEGVEFPGGHLGSIDSAERAARPNHHEWHQKECDGRPRGGADNELIHLLPDPGTGGRIEHLEAIGHAAADMFRDFEQMVAALTQPHIRRDV